MYERKDHFYKRAKREGKASRAAYKIEEIQEKSRLIRAGDAILELGAAPGGWMQMLVRWIGPKGLLIGIDRAPLTIHPAGPVVFFQSDCNAPHLAAELKKILGNKKGFNVIVSDLSPDLTGITFRDNTLSLEMAQKVFEYCQTWLTQGGHCVFKVFPSEEFNRFRQTLKTHFESMALFVPEATRKTSSEVYVIAKGFKKP